MCACVATGEGCVHPPDPRRGSGASFETWKGTQVPLVYEVGTVPQAHWVSPGFRRRRPVNPSFPAARGPSEGAQDGCRIRAGELGARGRNRSSKGAASWTRNPRCPQAVMFSELAPSPASADPRGAHRPLPSCHGKFPPEGSPLAAETQECPDSRAQGGL